MTVESAGGHSHTVTVDETTLDTSQIPKHNHSGSITLGPTSSYNAHGDSGIKPTFGQRRITKVDTTSGDASTGTTSNTGGSDCHHHTASCSSYEAHAHQASTNSTGAHSHTVATLPPYYALAYIIKL